MEFLALILRFILDVFFFKICTRILLRSFIFKIFKHVLSSFYSDCVFKLSSVDGKYLQTLSQMCLMDIFHCIVFGLILFVPSLLQFFCMCLFICRRRRYKMASTNTSPREPSSPRAQQELNLLLFYTHSSICFFVAESYLWYSYVWLCTALSVPLQDICDLIFFFKSPVVVVCMHIMYLYTGT